jgi:hypothetical protein
MKSIAKFLLVGTFALTAIAISAAPSEAAKKHRAMKSCEVGSHCSTGCANGSCSMKVCGSDGKWYAAVLTPVCLGTTCPSACR